MLQHQPTLSGSRKQPDQARVPAVTLSSRSLFGVAQTLFIDHAGQRYTLRITRENKLILTK